MLNVYIILTFWPMNNLPLHNVAKQLSWGNDYVG